MFGHGVPCEDAGSLGSEAPVCAVVLPDPAKIRQVGGGWGGGSPSGRNFHAAAKISRHGRGAKKWLNFGGKPPQGM
jgi:hypothetical protein